jgi:multidrug efflux pump subunit AcrA (membrane-fusion protein)
MKTPLCFLLLVLGLATPAWAVLVDFSFRYDRLALRNGRELKDVVLKTYDTATGRVGAAAGRELFTVRLADLPADAAARIQELVPAQTAEEIKAEQEQAAADLKAARERAREREQAQQAAAKTDRDAQRSLDVKRAENAIEQAARTETDVTEAAKSLAEYYFTYEADRHSSVGYVLGKNLLLDTPEPVPGWTNRWRVRGKVGVQYLTRDQGAVGRNAKEFELLLEVPERGSPKLVDVTISRM